MRILLISRRNNQCGVNDYGKRLHAILNPHIPITYREVESLEDCDPTGFDIVLYNYHYATLPFIRDSVLAKGVKHYAIFHEAALNFTPDKVIDTSIRPLFEDMPLHSAGTLVPIIGSFGFGFPDKNFPEIARRVRDQFSEATIRLNIPFADYGDRDGVLARRQVERVKEVLEGSAISLEVSHDYRSQMDLVRWLAENTINLFLYSPSHGRGLASATDYALSAYRPVGVSDSEMFRHLPASLANPNIKELINGWFDTLKPVYEEHSNKNLIERYKQFLQ